MEPRFNHERHVVQDMILNGFHITIKCKNRKVVPGLLQQPQLDLAEALHEEQRQAMAERAAELRMEPRPRKKLDTELEQLPRIEK